MNRNRLILTGILAILFSVVACKEEESSSTGMSTEESIVNANPNSLPSFNMQDINGNSIQLDSFAGKKVFVNLWATWCPPCREEIPSIEALQRSVDTTKVKFVLLSLDENFEVARNFALKQKMTLPVFFPGEDLPDLFITPGIPATFIFNERGDLIKKNMGAADYNTEEYRALLGSR